MHIYDEPCLRVTRMQFLFLVLSAGEQVLLAGVFWCFLFFTNCDCCKSNAAVCKDCQMVATPVLLGR